MSRPYVVPSKSVREIAREWDAIASVRAHQQSSGIDMSYDAVLLPTVLALLGPDRSAPSLLDIGCGTGVLTALLAPTATRTVAVDPSQESIAQARLHAKANGLEDSIEWHPLTVEAFAESTTETFDYLVANMSLMDIPNLSEAMRAIAQLARNGSSFIWTVTHPWFWPRYWGYEAEPWFRYNEEQFIEAEFKISNHSTGLTTTHVHRPLRQYMHALFSNGFVVECLGEPVPDAETMAQYPEPWTFPRFLAGRCAFRV